MFCICLQSSTSIGKNIALRTWGKERRSKENFITRDLISPEYIEPETGSDTASDTDRPIQIVTGRKQLHRRVDIAVDLRNFVHAVWVEFATGNQVKLGFIGNFHVSRNIRGGHKFAVVTGHEHDVRT